MCENRFCPVLRAGLLSHCCDNSVSYFITGLSHIIEEHEDPRVCDTFLASVDSFGCLFS